MLLYWGVGGEGGGGEVIDFIFLLGRVDERSQYDGDWYVSAVMRVCGDGGADMSLGMWSDERTEETFVKMSPEGAMKFGAYKFLDVGCGRSWQVHSARIRFGSKPCRAMAALSEHQARFGA